ncbi:hypothetical protein [Pseudoalteromonas sp.]|uniref:hypothetical protein n=1 Tax=Pseudoalteromonas sp. TaxID=53249 RepID=UPI0035633600
MDIMIPYLGQITRLTLEPKGAFHIAGVSKSTRSDKVQLEERKKRELEKKQKRLAIEDHRDNTPSSEADQEAETHLDTWA